MLIGQSRFIVRLMPSRLDGVLVSGRRVTKTRRVPLATADWDNAWEDGLLAYDTALSTVLQALGAGRRSTVDVLYAGPSTLSDVRFLPAVPDPSQAALEALRERVNYAANRLVCASDVLDVDAVKPDQRAVVSVCDRDEHAQAIFGWIARSGRRLGSIIPEHPLRLRRIIRDTAALDEEDRIMCDLGERTTVIACGGAGKIRAVRSIDFGYTLLAEAYTRGMRQESEENPGETSRPAQRDAVKQLFEFGIPGNQRAYEGREVLRRVMPLLQPVLQRYCIEVKQTLRFGLPGLETPPIGVRFTGPGVAIPGLCAAIAQNVELDTETDPQWLSFDHSTVDSERSIQGELIAHGPSEFCFSPRIAVEQASARRISAGLRAGAICAGAVIAFEAATVLATRHDVKSEIRDATPQLDAVRLNAASAQRANELAESLDRALTATSEAVGEQPNWAAVFAELGMLLNDSVTLEEIRGFRERESNFLAISGSVMADDDPNGTLDVGQIMDRFKNSRLFANVQLGATVRVTTPDAETTRFSLRAEPVTFRSPEEFALAPDSDAAEVTP